MRGAPANLELVVIDDDIDPFKPTLKLPKINGAVIGREQGSWGAKTQCLMVPFAEGDKFRDVAKSLGTWAKSVKVPEGARLGFGRLWDREGIKMQPFVRSYVLRGPPIVTSVDVASAKAAVSDVYPWVEITLNAGGVKLLQEAKRKHPLGRFAVILDGEVRRAADVQYMSADGFGFSVGSGSFEADMAEAKRLATAIKP